MACNSSSDDTTHHSQNSLSSAHERTPAYDIASWIDKEGNRQQSVISHRRGKVFAVCRLCSKEKNLNWSHVVPKWARRLFNTGAVRHTVGGHQSYIERQDLEKFYLLCAECEQYLGYAERHLSILCRGRPDEMAAHGISVTVKGTMPGMGIATLSGINQPLILRALLGIVFKSYYAEGDVSRRIKELDERFITRLRLRLLRDEYPPHAYHLHAIKWYDPRPIDMHPKGAVYITVNGYGNHREVVVLVGGISFFLVLQGKKPSIAEVERDFRGNFTLLKGRSWSVSCADIVQWLGVRDSLALSQPLVTLEDMAKLADILREQGWVAEHERCPCGNLGLTFQQCCEDRWVTAKWVEETRALPIDNPSDS